MTEEIDFVIWKTWIPGRTYADFGLHEEDEYWMPMQNYAESFRERKFKSPKAPKINWKKEGF